MTRLLSILFALALGACGAPSGGGDGGEDGGGDAAADTGGGDTGSGDTGGTDTGGTDAGSDAATDAGDAGADGGGSGCAANFAGCSTYEDRTASGADRTVTFSCCSYTAKCIKIKAGQSVTFSGTFSSHPLRPSCGPAATIVATSTGSSASFTFNTTGDYGFNCNFHGQTSGSGMAGSIRVEP